jgi:hypothetical protein
MELLLFPPKLVINYTLKVKKNTSEGKAISTVSEQYRPAIGQYDLTIANAFIVLP